MLVHTKDMRENYNSILETLAGDAFKSAVAYFESVVDENGNGYHLNFEDVCNTITNAAQLARRNYVAASNVKGEVPIDTGATA